MTAIAQCGKLEPELASCTLPLVPDEDPFPAVPVAVSLEADDNEASTDDDDAAAAADADDIEARTEFANVVSAHHYEESVSRKNILWR